MRKTKNMTLAESKRRRFWKDNIINTAMAMPPFLGFLLFWVVPMAVALVISFTELHSYDFSMAKWVGLRNYTEIWKSNMLWTALGNTLWFCLSVPINLVLVLFLSNLLDKKMAGYKLWRVVMFIPKVCAGVAVTLAWQWIFEENYGVINTLLEALNISKVPFFTDPTSFRIAVLIIAIWQSGTNVILLDAAYANIDRSLEEAARIDGATEYQVFWNVRFPALTPTLFYCVTMNLIAALQEQTVMQIITTNGVGPANSAVTLVYYIYRMAFVYTPTMGFGMACALSWVTALFIMVITKINFKLGEFWVHYD